MSITRASPACVEGCVKKTEERKGVFGDTSVSPLTGADVSVANMEGKMSSLCLAICLKRHKKPAAEMEVEFCSVTSLVCGLVVFLHRGLIWPQLSFGPRSVCAVIGINLPRDLCGGCFQPISVS